mmetsp:Transcript_6590/g.16437  ORF Transcript_6590/g.16437 Transcript_6590/m.16437 type:complete len:419 (-) Transcript_6590:3173-4429(-)
MDTQAFLRHDAREVLSEWMAEGGTSSVFAQPVTSPHAISGSGQQKEEYYSSLVKEINENLAKKWNQSTQYRNEYCRHGEGTKNLPELAKTYTGDVVEENKREEFEKWMKSQSENDQAKTVDELRKISTKVRARQDENWNSTYVDHYPWKDPRPHSTGMVNFHQSSMATSIQIQPRDMRRELETSLGFLRKAREMEKSKSVRAPKRKPKLMPHLQKSGNLIGSNKNTGEIGSTYKTAFNNSRPTIGTDTPQLKFDQTASVHRVIPSHSVPLPESAVRLPILKEAPGRDVMRIPQRIPTNHLLSTFRTPEQATEGSNTVYGLEYTQKVSDCIRCTATSFPVALQSFVVVLCYFVMYLFAVVTSVEKQGCHGFFGIKCTLFLQTTTGFSEALSNARASNVTIGMLELLLFRVHSYLTPNRL